MINETIQSVFGTLMSGGVLHYDLGKPGTLFTSAAAAAAATSNCCYFPLIQLQLLFR